MRGEGLSSHPGQRLRRHRAAGGGAEAAEEEADADGMFAGCHSGATSSMYNHLIQANQDLFRDFPYIYHFLYNGLDFNRVCTPEHITEKSISTIF